MTPTLYGDERSPCVRAILLTVKAIDMELKFVNLDLCKGDQLSPEYLKINPQHTVPTLDDNGIIIWDSHAIMIYLVEKYGKNSTLYPSDLAKRATVNRLLFFDSGNLFAPHLKICKGVLYGWKEIPEGSIEPVKIAVKVLELFLQKSKYVAGDDLTIADFSIWTTLSNAENWLAFDFEETKFSKIFAWKKIMSDLPYANINLKGAKLFKELIDTKLERKI